MHDCIVIGIQQLICLYWSCISSLILKAWSPWRDHLIAKLLLFSCPLHRTVSLLLCFHRWPWQSFERSGDSSEQGYKCNQGNVPFFQHLLLHYTIWLCIWEIWIWTMNIILLWAHLLVWITFIAVRLLFLTLIGQLTDTSKSNSTLRIHLHAIIRTNHFDFDVRFWHIRAVTLKT